MDCERTRQVVLTEMSRIGLTINQLATTMEYRKQVSRNTVIRWLNGHGNITDQNLDMILDRVGLEVRRKK